MLELLMILGTFDCSNMTQMNLLVLDTWESKSWSHVSCVPFAYAVGKQLTQLNCSYHYITGWNAPSGTYGRQWHRWIETPYFQVVDSTGVWYNTTYDKRYDDTLRKWTNLKSF
jgi:hypothetical protein